MTTVASWQPIETAPKDREVLFWVVPLSAEETYRDTSGNPITSGAQPRVMFCRFGHWSSLSKATHWADVPTGCLSETKSEEPEPEPTDALTLEQLTAAIAFTDFVGKI